MEWKKEALCREIPNELFFDGWYKLTKPEKQEIVNVCNACPVIQRCYEYAVKSQSHGVWAGKDFRNGNPYSPFSTRKRDELNFAENVS